MTLYFQLTKTTPNRNVVVQYMEGGEMIMQHQSMIRIGDPLMLHITKLYPAPVFYAFGIVISGIYHVIQLLTIRVLSQCPHMFMLTWPLNVKSFQLNFWRNDCIKALHKQTSNNLTMFTVLYTLSSILSFTHPSALLVFRIFSQIAATSSSSAVFMLEPQPQKWQFVKVPFPCFWFLDVFKVQ